MLCDQLKYFVCLVRFELYLDEDSHHCQRRVVTGYNVVRGTGVELM